MELVEKRCTFCGYINYFPNPPLHPEHRCLECGTIIYPKAIPKAMEIARPTPRRPRRL